MKLCKLAAFTAAPLMAMAAPAQAAPIVFNFEEAATGDFGSVSETESGVSLTVSRENGTFLSVNNISGSSNAPAGFGTRSLSPFSNTVGDAFILNFSSLISSISLQTGDFQPSDDDTFTLQIFSGANGTGTLLGTTSASQNGTTGFPTFTTLSLASATAFGSATFIGGSQSFPNSVFFDNVTIDGVTGAVPEPSTWAMLILGFGAVGAALRRRRQVARLHFA